jgi:hypothetical protein
MIPEIFCRKKLRKKVDVASTDFPDPAHLSCPLQTILGTEFARVCSERAALWHPRVANRALDQLLSCLASGLWARTNLLEMTDGLYELSD